MDPYMINELILDYNNNPQHYSDAEAETIATLAQAIGSDFKRESKPFSKGLFDLVDTAAFGLIPNEYRPTSRGESVFGETGAEEFAGLLGLGAGAVGGIGGAYKGGRGLFNYFKKKRGAKGGSDPISNVREQTKLLGEPQRLLSGQTSRQIRRNRFPLDSRSGNSIPMTSRAGDAIPMGGNINRPINYTDQAHKEIKKLMERLGIQDEYLY